MLQDPQDTKEEGIHNSPGGRLLAIRPPTKNEPKDNKLESRVAFDESTTNALKKCVQISQRVRVKGENGKICINIGAVAGKGTV